VIVTLD